MLGLAFFTCDASPAERQAYFQWLCAQQTDPDPKGRLLLDAAITLVHDCGPGPDYELSVDALLGAAPVRLLVHFCRGGDATRALDYLRSHGADPRAIERFEGRKK